MNERAIVYARVSGDDRGKEGRNLAGQLEMCREYAQERGYSIVAELTEDDRGASGYDLDLPELSKVRDLAQARDFDILVVREVDRLARNLAKCQIVEDELRRYDVRVEYALYDFPDTPEGRLNKNIYASFAEFEREKIAERTARARRRKLRSGHVIVHGRPPFGYKLVEGEDGKATLKPDEQEAKTVRLIFDWYTVGDGGGKPLAQKRIAQQLTQMKIPTYADLHNNGKGDQCYKKRGFGVWSISTVSDILGNEVYAGMWRSGRKRKGAEVVEIPVTPIISREQWETVQARKRENKRNSKRRCKREYLLRRRVRCAQCNRAMRARAMQKGKYLYYVCHHAENEFYCTQKKNFRADWVDVTVWDFVCRLFTDRELFLRGLRREQEKREETAKLLRNQLAIANDLLAEHKSKLERLLDLYLGGDLPKEMLLERKRTLEKTIADLGRERTRLSERIEAAILTDEQIETLAVIIDEVGEGLDLATADFEKRRWLIEKLNLSARLEVIDGEPVAHVECYAGYQTLSIVSVSPRTRGTGRGSKAVARPGGWRRRGGPGPAWSSPCGGRLEASPRQKRHPYRTAHRAPAESWGCWRRRRPGRRPRTGQSRSRPCAVG